ncbi:MAG: ATP-binding protein, partial [Chloroflexota bacterium]
EEEVRLGEALRRAAEGAGTRLFTLTGPGGVGKTRLALAVAAAMQETFIDGVTWVDLSDVRDPGLATSAAAQALDVHPDRSQTARDALISHVGDSLALLVFDNFEQVVDAAPLVSDLMTYCPRLVVLVTSRSALRVRGEQQFRVPPLGLPDPDRRLPLEALAGFAATRLFVARARAVRPDFSLRADQAEAVAEICRRVDGLPLAIELAAARVALLSPTALLARLESRLTVLRGGARDLPGRQRTMRAAIDWSYDLLSPGEQALFRRFAVFQGGCTIEAAESVCAVFQNGDVLEGISSLLEKSLLIQRDQLGETRLSMLETLQEYAREQLAAHGETEAARQAHAAYWLARAEADWTQDFVNRRSWLAYWEREHDNVRAALGWARERGEAEFGLRLSNAVWRLWVVHGHLNEGRAWLDALLRLSGPVAGPIRARALRGVAALAVQLGDLEQGAAWCESCLALSLELDDQPLMADVLNTLGNIARNRGAFDPAVDYYQRSLAIYRALSDRVGEAVVLNNRGTVARYQGNLTLATALYQDSLAIRREEDDNWGIAYILHNLSVVAWRRGDLEQAGALSRESLALRRELGDRQGMADCLTVLAYASRAGGELDQAAAYFRDAVDLSRRIGNAPAEAAALIGLAGLAADRGDAARAARLLGMAALRRAAGQSAPPPEHDRYDEEMVRVQAMLGEPAWTTLWTAGRDLSAEAALSEALGLKIVHLGGEERAT